MNLTLTRPYTFRNGRKLKGDLDQRIAQALDALADCPEVFEIDVPERSVRHSKTRAMFDLIGQIYESTRGFVVKVGVYGRKGHGKMVQVYCNGIGKAREFADYVRTKLQKNPEEYFPESAQN